MKKILLNILALFLMMSNVSATDVRMYIFGHSLIDHSTGSDETTVPFWINEIAQSSSHGFAVGGQYGFLPTHQTPPASNWGYTGVTSVWEDNLETFAQANIDTILLTVANFVQYQPANINYESNDPVWNITSPLNETQRIFDWVNNQGNPVKYYLYENWPEMDLQNAFPPTTPMQSEIDVFHQYTVNGFHDWWVEYNDFIQIARPQYDIELIAVGSIVSKILTEVIPNQIAFTDLYEDSAPHGKANIYFLAAMVTYVAIYDENIPSNYVPASTNIHIAIKNNISQIRNFIWQQLNTNVLIFKNGFEH